MRRWLLLGLLGIVSCWRRPAPPAPDRHVAVGLVPETFSLENGLHVVLVPDPRASQVLVTMVYGVGAADDPRDGEGTAHLVEHVLFEPVVDGASLQARLQALALDVNGFTMADTTAYSARAWPDRLPGLLALEAERLAHRCETVSDAAFARAREIVRNEAREHEGAWELRANLDEALFGNGERYHREAATLAGLAAITREQACAFADAHYGTNNAVLVVSGAVTRDDLRHALAATLAPIARQVHVAEHGLSAIAPGRDSFAAAVSSPIVLVTWPVPDDPLQRAQAKAVIAMLARIVGTKINSGVSIVEVGGAAGRGVAIAISLSSDETTQQVLAGVKQARYRMQDWFGSGLFELAREREVYKQIDELADGVDRDIGLAEDVLAARDPAQTVAARIAALHGLSRDAAKAIAENLTVETAHITEITAQDTARTVTTSLAQPIDQLPSPLAADPKAAHRPLDAPARDPLSGLRTRTLPTGLRVVMMPSTSVHTFDARLVLPAGAAAEPASQRGVAMLAAHGLSLNPGDAAMLLHFYTGGGAFEVDVGFDTTMFETSGLSGQLDKALVALAQLISDGVYRDLDETRRELAMSSGADLVFTRLWRGALYGDSHPYVDAGLWRYATVQGVDPVLAFRAQHYVPRGATLILVGGFDPDLADRWIEYAFADWRGDAPPPAEIPARPSPFVFSQVTSGSLRLHVAFAVHAPEPVALVATEMLSRALRDVREELAASYGVNASLIQTRAGAAIMVSGEIDAARAADACALIRDRIARLREPSPDTDARFVDARTRTLDRLVARPAASTLLAAQLEEAVALGRDPDDQRRTASAVSRLTVEDVAPALRSVDLQHAAMVLQGPQTAIDAAASAFGRHATNVGPEKR